jgi:hypothetical protein
MAQYWLRIAGAWFLLSMAGRMMKSAEAVLKAAQEAKSIDEPEVEVTIEEATANFNGNVVDQWVEAKYDG